MKTEEILEGQAIFKARTTTSEGLAGLLKISEARGPTTTISEAVVGPIIIISAGPVDPMKISEVQADLMKTSAVLVALMIISGAEVGPTIILEAQGDLMIILGARAGQMKTSEVGRTTIFGVQEDLQTWPKVQVGPLTISRAPVDPQATSEAKEGPRTMLKAQVGLQTTSRAQVDPLIISGAKVGHQITSEALEIIRKLQGMKKSLRTISEAQIISKDLVVLPVTIFKVPIGRIS